MSETTLLKPIVMGATIVALDKFVMKTTNMNESLYFGLAGAVGVYTGGMVAKAMQRLCRYPFHLVSTLTERLLK